jgi:type IV pilus assembly protein PilA
MKNVNLKKKMLGQGMTEYIIIVALIGIAAIGVFRLFGDTARNQMAAMAAELGGKDGTASVTAAGAAATEAATDAVVKRDLSNFAGNNKGK